MMCGARLVAVLAAIALVLSATPLTAQTTTTGSITGTVRDSQGGILPGVTVIATSDALVSGRQVNITNASGVFRFPSLPPGVYAVEGQLSGFRSVRQENVVLGLGQLVKLELELGDPEFSEEILVVAEAVRVDTVTNTVSHNLDTEFLERQPLPRDANALMNYTPGVNDGAAYGAPNSQGSAYNLDGVDVSDPASGGQWILPNFDWVQEVQVTGLGADAEYGGFSGAVVNLITKSGGNELSGDVRAFYSGASLNSENSPEGVEGTNSLDTDWDASVSIGGKIIQDRLWYFVSGQERERTVDPFFSEGAPADEQGDSVRSWSRYMGKLTFQANESNRFVVLADYDGVEHERRGVGEFLLASGARNQDSPNWSYNGTWESILGDSSFLQFKITGFQGTNDFLARSGDIPNRFDSDSDFDWQNYLWDWRVDKERVNADLSWSFYADSLLASNDSHTFKFGVVYEDSSQDEVRLRSGGFSYYDRSRYCDDLDSYFADPECAIYSSDRGNEIDFHAVQKGLHLYAQDTWQINRVSVNAGVRYTDYDGGFQGGDSNVYDVDMIAPRIGFAWDLFGDGATAIKAHWGRYYEGLMAFMYDRESSGDAFTPFEIWDWDFDVDDWVLYDSRPTGGAAMDPGISHPYVDQWVLSFEHQLSDTILLGADYLHRENSDIIAMVNVNDDYDGLIAPDNPLTGGDLPFFELLSEQEFVLTNPQEAFRDYDALMLRLNRRYADGWSLRASLVWSDLTGNTQDVDGYEGAWEDLNGLVNSEGNVPGNSEWELKVNATVDLPWDIVLGGYYLYRSGTYWTPYARIDGLLENNRTNINLVPLGSEQLDDRHLLDLHLDKRIALGSKTDLLLILDVFNLLNSDTVLDVSERWGTYYYQWDAHPEESEWVQSSSYAAPLDVEDGREVRLGVKLSF